jgi:uncharacterized repeat protein (TIGR03803 family)
LILSENTLYGTAEFGGVSDAGTVFKLNTDGASFTVLHSFPANRVASGVVPTNHDGMVPSGLTLSVNTLYGTTSGGGISGGGTVFKLNTDGTAFVLLHSFAAGGDSSWGSFTNNDGSGPTDGLILSSNTLYGTTSLGGRTGFGTIFALATDGTGFTILHSFGEDQPFRTMGATPLAGLILSGKTLYGTTEDGGDSDAGTVFSLTLPSPPVTLIPSGANVILSWPTNYAGFDYSGYTLESTTDLGSLAWTSNLPVPAILNGQKSVTVPVTGRQQFFRLRQ